MMDYGSIVLPSLKGSAKQVSWAEDVRDKLLDEYLGMIDKLEDSECENLENKFTKINSASWWIGVRYLDVDMLISAGYNETLYENKDQ